MRLCANGQFEGLQLVADRRAISDLAHDLGDLAVADHPLAYLTTYRLGGPASLFSRPKNVDELLRIAQAVAGSSVPVLVLGRGSNLLIADAGFDGLVVSVAELGDQFTVDDDRVTCSAGMQLPVADPHLLQWLDAPGSASRRPRPRVCLGLSPTAPL